MTTRYTPSKLKLPVSALAKLKPMSKKRNNEESRSQRAVIKWWHHACAGLGIPEILLMSIPNGGGRSGPRMGAIMKAEGLRAGAPDLFLAVPSTLSNGLFIELKTESGRPSKEQEEFHHQLQKYHYHVEVCRSAEEAIKVITEYLP